MSKLSEELAEFGSSIAQGADSPPHLLNKYRNYPSEVGIEIYRNNYFGNLRGALAGAYPVIEQLVGKDFFAKLAHQFISYYPSRNRNLHEYGYGLSNFLSSYEPVQVLPYLPDMAKLEWACHRAYFSDETEHFDFSTLSQIPPKLYSGLVLHTHPSCHILNSTYPIVDIWLAHQPGGNSDFLIQLDYEPCNALVRRVNDIVQVSEITAPDDYWLKKIKARSTLGDALDEIFKKYPDFDLQTALLNMLGLGILTGFELRAEP